MQGDKPLVWTSDVQTLSANRIEPSVDVNS